MVDYFLKLSEAMGCPPESRRLELATTPDDERSADLVWERLGLRDDGRVMTFNCSGAYGSAKLWPIERQFELQCTALSLGRQKCLALADLLHPEESRGASGLMQKYLPHQDTSLQAGAAHVTASDFNGEAGHVA